MNTADFNTELTPDGRIALPPEIASQVPAGETIRVMIHWGDNADEAAWRAAGRRRFESAYADDDSIYEQLVNDPPAR